MKSSKGKNHEFITACKDSYIKGKKKGQEDGFIEGIAFSSKNYSAIVILILKDKFDFTNEQVQTATANINNYFDSLVRGDVSFGDVTQSLKDDYGIDLNFKQEA